MECSAGIIWTRSAGRWQLTGRAAAAATLAAWARRRAAAAEHAWIVPAKSEGFVATGSVAAPAVRAAKSPARSHWYVLSWYSRQNDSGFPTPVARNRRRSQPQAARATPANPRNLALTSISRYSLLVSSKRNSVIATPCQRGAVRVRPCSARRSSRWEPPQQLTPPVGGYSRMRRCMNTPLHAPCWYVAKNPHKHPGTYLPY